MKQSQTAIALSLIAVTFVLGVIALPSGPWQFPRFAFAAGVEPPAEPEGEELIETLVSQNSPPKLVKRRAKKSDDKVDRAVFEDDYNWADQTRVLAAIKSLTLNAERDWPVIRAHRNDDRYCITLRWNHDRNYSVGDVCCMIARANLRAPYLDCLSERLQSGQAGFIQKSPVGVLMPHEESAWLNQRGDKRLYELQIELADWAIFELDEFEQRKRTAPGEVAAIEKIKANSETLRTQKRAIVAGYDRFFHRANIYINKGRDVAGIRSPEAEKLPIGK